MKTRRSRRAALHIASALCLVAAAALCCWLFRLSASGSGRMYDSDDFIAGESDSYQAVRTHLPPMGEDGQLHFELDGFTGSRTIHILELAEEETLSFSWNIAVGRGRFKVVLVDTEGARVLRTMGEGAGSGSLRVNDLPAAQYRIKLVGDRSAADGTLWIGQGAG